MGNDIFQLSHLRCLREINFNDQLMNILCSEVEKLKPFYEGGTIALTQKVLLWLTGRFQTLIKRWRKHIPRIQNAEEKDEYDNESAKSFK